MTTNIVLTEAQKNTLMHVASESIKHQLLHRKPLAIQHDQFDEALRQNRATFVTLHLNQALRGCIGMLEATRPLVLDVAHNASSAAFNDPRFPPVNQRECDNLEIHISILSQPEEMLFNSEKDLLDQIRVNIDGLILDDGGYRRGTFLPSVWEQLPSPEMFLKHLKQKAGLPVDYWSDSIRVYRYTTDSIGQTE